MNKALKVLLVVFAGNVALFAMVVLVYWVFRNGTGV